MDHPRSPKPLSNQGAGRSGRLARWLDLVLPPHCVLCARAAPPTLLCDACLSRLPQAAPGCPVCGIEHGEAGWCGRCLGRTPAFDRTIACFRYAPPLDRLIQSLKYGHDLAIAQALGTCMAAVMPPLAVDLIVPVPLHRARLAERGFNQSVELARPVARALGRPIVHEATRRRRQTQAQAGLSLAGRRRNLTGAFEARRRFDDLHVLVVDDVMTSGATLEAFARCLKRAGAAQVSNLVCARTPTGR